MRLERYAALDRLALEMRLDDAQQEALRLAFAHACVARVRHLLEQHEVDACLAVLECFVQGQASRDELTLAAERAAALANAHGGSKSIDGCGHAAVSASYAVARATAGRALDAASYAAYAAVYAQGGYAAVADRDAFAVEHAWQTAALQTLFAQDAAQDKAQHAAHVDS